MATIQIKHVPDDVHETLRRRAAEKGQSLQEYMLAQLKEQAQMAELEQVLERAGRRTGGRVTLAEAADLVRADRDSR